jgi:hypothetical protein
MEVFAIDVHTIISVGEWSILEMSPKLAKVGAPLSAVATTTTTRDKRGHNMISRTKSRYSRSYFFDNPRSFVARAHRQRTGMAAIKKVKIAVTQATGDVANEYLMVSR